jgi:DNA-binding XRE family transcriptional regulator
MEQREKSMGAGASAKAEAVTEVVRPARYVAEPEDIKSESKAREAREHKELTATAPNRPKSKKASGKTNRLRETRIEKMMSKAELARRANLSVLTIDRVEKGLGCRMDTKRKILEALGLSLADRVRVFGEEE